MSLALFASPVECKDDYLEHKINKEKTKLNYQSLQTQLKPTSAHGAFNAMTTKDWLEAFAHHPMIGDVKSIREKIWYR